ncbi:hypothetical protein [Paractinoplanes brasiliensis]|uniref:hypothetical protein n=1 Tax=Paractinoplanes brasiliensis TaxID=52695 RepID=UPI0010623AAB|nr:hypothetical protein [Actinoplanes brasiliensis]GID32841.1 hypothetical protein Abr02nite_78240 [Actinoplanes brasiliensis]
MLRDRPELAVRAGSAALSAIAAAPAMPLDVLAAIESAFPQEPTADLHAGIAAITERLARELAGHADDPVRAGALALKLGWRLFESGRVRDGLALLTEAVAIARRPPAQAAQLELALRSLGRACTRAKDWATAADALGQAAELWNDRCTPPAEDVAACLADLSLALWNQGRDTSSLSTRHRAIAQLRRLVVVDGRYRLTLIRVLVQQAEQLRRGDRRRDALEALDEALGLLQAVAGNAGAGLELDFAAALLGRAMTLHSLRQHQEASFAASGAVAVFRRLAEVNVFYDKELARARQVEAQILADRTAWGGALDALAETIAIHRRLVRISAERHELDLVQALLKFARVSLPSGLRTEAALGGLDEVIERVRAPRFDAVRDRLVLAARTIGADILDKAGRAPEADAMRDQRHRPASPPPGQRGARMTRAQVADVARSLGNQAPYSARLRLEKLSPPDIAAVIVALNRPLDWLELMFRGFTPDQRLAIVHSLVLDRALLDNQVVLGYVVRLIRDSDDENFLRLLHRATPEIAAVFLDYIGRWASRPSTSGVERARVATVIRQAGHYLPPDYPSDWTY